MSDIDKQTQSEQENAQSEFENRDLRNPKDREALNRAADDYLKARKSEAQNEAEETEQAGENDPVEALVTENAELKDQLLRLAADMENLRRRTAREVQDAKSFSIANFARDMLSVADNLQRALDAIPEGSREQDETLKTLAEGVEMTERAMMAAMERHGVKKISPEGQKFDPNFHQAMFEIPDADMPNNTVKQVVQPGYVIGERMLRPAMVGVSKGGPKDA